MPDQRLQYLISTAADLGGATAAEQAFHKLQSSADEFINSIKQGVGIDLGQRLVESLASLPARFREAIDAGVAFNTTLESAQLSIASLIRQFEPSKFGSVEAALGKSRDTVEALKKAAADSPASFSSLVEGLRATAGASFSAGISLEKQVPLLVSVANAAKSFGIANEQLAQETKALLNGQVDENAALANGLGIKRDELILNKERGKLYEFLTSRLKNFEEAGRLASQTFEGLRSNLGDTLDVVRAEASEPIFDALKEAMASLRKELERPEVAAALKALGFEIAEIVKTGSSLVNFAVQNADALVGLGRAAGVAAAAFAAIKLRDLIEALTLKTARLVGLVPPLAAATAGTTALAAAEEREVVAANSAAAAEGRLAAARASATQAGAAGALTPAVGGAGAGAGAGGLGGRVLSGLFGGAGAAGIVGGLALKEYIDSLSAGILQMADAADKAGSSFKDFQRVQADAIKSAKTFADATKAAGVETQKALDDARKKLADYEKSITISVQETDALGSATGRVVSVTRDLSEAEKSVYDVLQNDVFLLEKKLKYSAEIARNTRGGEQNRAQTPLTDAEKGALEDPLKKDRERRIGDLAPAAQVRVFSAQLNDEFTKIKKQLVDAGADAGQVARIKDLDTLRQFADANKGLKGQEIAVKAYEKIAGLQDNIAKASEAAAKAQTDGASDVAALQKKANDLFRDETDLTRQRNDLQTDYNKALSDELNLRARQPTDAKEAEQVAQDLAAVRQKITEIAQKQREIEQGITADVKARLEVEKQLAAAKEKQAKDAREEAALAKDRAAAQPPPAPASQPTVTRDQDGTIRYAGGARSTPTPGAQGPTSAPLGDLTLDANGRVVSPSGIAAGAAAGAFAPALFPGLPNLPGSSLANSPVRLPGDPLNPNTGGFPIPVPPTNFPGLAAPGGGDAAGDIKGAADATKDNAETLKSAGADLKAAAEKESAAATENLPPAAAAAQAAGEALGTNLPPLKAALETTAGAVQKELPSLSEAASKIGPAIESGLNAAAKSLEGVGGKVEKGTTEVDGKVTELGNAIGAGFERIVGSFTAQISALNAKIESLSSKFESYAG